MNADNLVLVKQMETKYARELVPQKLEKIQQNDLVIQKQQNNPIELVPTQKRINLRCSSIGITTVHIKYLKLNVQCSSCNLLQTMKLSQMKNNFNLYGKQQCCDKYIEVTMQRHIQQWNLLQGNDIQEPLQENKWILGDINTTNSIHVSINKIIFQIQCQCSAMIENYIKEDQFEEKMNKFYFIDSEIIRRLCRKCCKLLEVHLQYYTIN